MIRITIKPAVIISSHNQQQSKSLNITVVKYTLCYATEILLQHHFNTAPVQLAYYKHTVTVAYLYTGLVYPNALTTGVRAWQSRLLKKCKLCNSRHLISFANLCGHLQGHT